MDNLSPQTKIAAAGGGGVVIAAAGTSIAMKWWVIVWFLAILIVLLLIALGIYFGVRAWRKKRQGRQMYGDMEQNTTAAPRGMNANKLGQLDDLRRKFQEGVQAFKSRGKDIYALPWYVVVGEPGSGKTEAIRHCNVGFPPGMQDAFQGAGGTINMNWWFTNQAVLLDTAGRLMFEEVKPGENSEWNEFLKLLKKNRPRCPINGMMLVIPSDSLIKDTADKIEAKAGKIAQQLDLIQRILDVRFPVYVVITKSDKVNGFREYFDGVTDPTLQHQMLGWSNPESLDTPFSPADVDKHLQSVADRLRKRRLGLLRDPIPEEQAHRRVDEVDALFAFPDSLTKLAPRLRKYLETIFTPGEWSSKPLFLRGIYFTSSMREGSELDQDLAEALGLAADQLPEGRTWEKERAYFLKDVFIEKAFRERGLVTNATNTGSELRKWKLIFYGFTFVLLSVFLVLAFFGYRDLRGSVLDREKYWSAAAAALESKQTDSYQLVVEDPSIPDKWSANTADFTVGGGRKMGVGEFHSELRHWAEEPISGKWYLPRIGKGYMENSRAAQQVFFEHTVLKPLVDAARTGLSRARVRDNDPNRTEALLTLMRLESDILVAGTGKKLELKSESASNFVASLYGFAAGQPPTADSNIVAVMVRTYAASKTPAEAWPPAWLSGTVTNRQGAITNEAIFGGLDAFIRNAKNTIDQQRTNFQLVLLLGYVMGNYRKLEDDLFLSRKKDDAGASVKLVEALTNEQRKVEINLANAQQSGVFSNSLSGALNDYRKLVITNSMQAFSSIGKMNDLGLERSPGTPLFLSISNRLDLEKNSFIKNLESQIPSGSEQRLKSLDESSLVESDGARVYAVRLDLYTRAARLVSQKRFADLDRTKLVADLDGLEREREKLLAALGGYSGPLATEVSNVCSFLTRQGFDAQVQAFGKKYLQVVKDDLDRMSAFPLVQGSSKETMDAEAVYKASRQLASIVADSDGPRFEKLGLSGSGEWKDQLKRAVQMKRLADWLVAPDKTVGNCTVSLLKMEDSAADEDDWRGKFRALTLVSDSGPGEKLRTNEPQDQKLGKVGLDRGLKLSLFRRSEDSAAEKALGADGKWQILRATLDPAYRPKANAGDRKSWLIFVPVEGEKGSVRLRLDFEQALPEWP